MSEIICSEPGCQTTAGCKCKLPFGVNFTWGHVKDLPDAKELARLRQENAALRTRISEMEAELTASMREIDRLRSKLEKAQRWADARLAVVNLSVRDPGYMNRFNDLAEAEDALSATIRAFAEGGK